MTSSTFHEVQFPADISVGAVGGPEFKTTILTLGSGEEKRNIEWSLTRYQGNIGTGLRERADFEVFQQFFYARYGRAYGFRFKDWSDYTIESQSYTVGDGVHDYLLSSGDAVLQLYKDYESGGYLFIRPILKPVAAAVDGSNAVRVNGTLLDQVAGTPSPGQYALDSTTGLITFGTALTTGNVVEVAYLEFDIPVRFDIDKLDMNMAAYEAGEWVNIPIIELKSGL